MDIYQKYTHMHQGVFNGNQVNQCGLLFLEEYCFLYDLLNQLWKFPTYSKYSASEVYPSPPFLLQLPPSLFDRNSATRLCYQEI